MLQRLTRPPRRILMTLDAVGGVWRYAVDLAEGLSRHGTAVVFAGVGPQPSPAMMAEARMLGEVVWLKTPPDWLATGPAELGGLPIELRRLAERHAVDLIHLNAPSQAAGLDAPCPVLAVSHSCVASWFQSVKGQSLPDGWAWHHDVNRKGFDDADLIVAPSQAHADLLQACYGPIETLSVVHNACAGIRSLALKQPFVFAAARWWDEGKNAAVLDEAAAALAWPVCMAGATIGPNGPSTTIRHAEALGERSHDEVRGMMARAGIFVSPSLYEPFGLAALEAASCGAALVLADIPTYRELWDDAAEFFDPRSADSLVAAADRLACDAGHRRRLGRAALTRARLHSPDNQAGRMLDLYAQAAAAAPAER